MTKVTKAVSVFSLSLALAGSAAAQGSTVDTTGSATRLAGGLGAGPTALVVGGVVATILTIGATNSTSGTN